jgi:hypothetical protein
MNRVVAITETKPNCLNVPVASGRARVAVNRPVIKFALADKVPGPSGSVKSGALMKVLPVTGYVALIGLAVLADAAPPLAMTAIRASRPAVPVTAVVLVRK